MIHFFILRFYVFAYTGLAKKVNQYAK